ncbi:unnamed protein product [Penicillium salamii]|uniref:N-acetyltransferase domain-containing protein n=1 Tax=Penicillium salamii TaxID=1612424 RepID=A0A9W4JDJ3_9EURO|nr:unnamed protein product [Penicillium salamii]CAG7974937.1 unnamed protein product [Penicillium salamii]CAG8033028.1 unnamed protein product [Penicillium salamii]CAG8058814.1 unnamed protein product [Penicillium salamii]CAG8101331.1 unnamed protein product [Penicillium salamii]
MASIQASVDLFKSERLIYRAPEDTPEDKEFIHSSILNDQTIQGMSTLRLSRPTNKNAADEFIKTLQGFVLGVLICLPVTSEDNTTSETPSNQSIKTIPIGHVNISNRFGPDTSHHRNAMLGISFAEGYRGQGYGAEAINWALDWAFQYGGFHRICLGAFSFNTNALKLYRKVGFREEGRERESVFRLRKWHDVIVMAMLEHEWEALRSNVSEN